MRGALVAGPLLHELGFNPRQVRVGFMVDRVALGQDFLRVLRVCPVSIIPSMLNIHVHGAPIRGNWSKPANLPKSGVISQSREC